MPDSAGIGRFVRVGQNHPAPHFPVFPGNHTPATQFFTTDTRFRLYWICAIRPRRTNL
jgi:hypothetical protein